jgi:acyl carrier protein
VNNKSEFNSEHTRTARSLLAAALQTGEDEIGEHTAIGTTERWDSLAHMRLILALEKHGGQQLDTGAMLAIESFSDVVQLIRETDC